MIETKIVSTPADPSVRLQKDDSHNKEVDKVQYQSVVGSLLYATMATHPGVAQAMEVI